MKKITFLAACLVGLTGIAQSLDAVSTTVSTSDTSRDGAAILWDQPREDTGGIVSCVNNIPQGVYSADDFVLAENSRIDLVTVYGFNNNQNLVDDLTGFSLYIYADNGAGLPNADPSFPGDGLFEAIDIDPADPALTVTQDLGNFDFTVDVTALNGGDFILPAGKYWVVGAPHIDIPDFDGANRWNWAQGTESAGGEDSALLIDVDDVFAGGFLNWTDFATLGIAWDGLQFTIDGEAGVLGVNDNLLSQVSVYPNPVDAELNVRVPSNVTVEAITMYDILGKDTGARLVNGTINTSNLARGVYILNVRTSAGTLTEKIVKQ